MNVALRSDSLNIISLCTGGGGLDLGVELAMPEARVVCMVEREAFAVAHLVEAMREGLLGQAPIWSDARTFAGRPWRGLVDGIIGGIPCQPHSLAGKRLADEDERDLWSAARRIIVQSGAWWVLIENVGGMLSSGGAERVWRDLRRLGFEVEGGLFRAAEVGASHDRERLFILAVANAACRSQRPRYGVPGYRATELQLVDSDQAVVDAIGRGCHRRPDEPQRGPQGRAAAEHPGEGGRAVADANVVELRRQPPAGEQRELQPDHGLGLFPPGPGDARAWAAAISRAPHLEPAVRRVADGLAAEVDNTRIDELRQLGNGVVPLQAAYALRTLATRLSARGSAGAALLVRLMMGEQP